MTGVQTCALPIFNEGGRRRPVGDRREGKKEDDEENKNKPVHFGSLFVEKSMASSVERDPARPIRATGGRTEPRFPDP